MSRAITEAAPEPTALPGARPGAWHRLAANGLTVLGLALVAAIVLIALSAPLLPLADPNVTETASRLQPPLAGGFVLGSDQLGRDLLSRLIWGTRVSLAVGVTATLVATVIGSLIGLVAAYYGRLVDNLLMRAIDMLMAFPYLLLALAIVAALGPGLLNAMLAISVVNIPFFARSVRGTTVGLMGREFIAAARLAGFGDARIIFAELLPNVLPVIVITMSTTVGWMILETAGLSFLGLGAQPPQADLGSMLGDGRTLVIQAPWVATLPGLVILFLVIGINLVGDGLRDVLDPRLKSGALTRPAARTAVDVGAGRPDASETTDALLSVQGLRVHFEIGREVHPAVDGVDLEIRRGEAVGLVGESGCGKSITALALLGLAPSPPGRIAGGEIRFQGEDLIAAPLARLQDLRGNRIAYVFQDPLTTLNPLMAVGEQIAESLRRHGGLTHAKAAAQVVTLLGRVGLPDPAARARSLPHELSGGQRQRVGIAIALANRPDLIIADEPTTALDVTTQQRVLELLAELRREQGAALLFISHDLAVVANLCERVLVMYAGRIVEAGPIGEVLRRPRHPYTRALIECIPVLGERERTLDAIPGLPPATSRLPPGCAFAPRCRHAAEICRQGEIPLRPIGIDHAARCVRLDEIDARPAARSAPLGGIDP